MAARCWRIYSGTTEQLLTVYAGTPTADVVAAVRELFGFSDRVPLRFRGADGVPVALSSHLPDKVCLHVAVEAGLMRPPPRAHLTGATINGPAVSEPTPGPAVGKRESASAAIPDMARLETASSDVALGSSYVFRDRGWAMTKELPCKGRYTWLVRGRIGCCCGIALLPGYYKSVDGSPAAAVLCGHKRSRSQTHDFDYARFSHGHGYPSEMAVARVDFDRGEFVVVRMAEHDKWEGCALRRGLNVRVTSKTFKMAVANVKHAGNFTVSAATNADLRTAECGLDSMIEGYEQQASGDVEGQQGATRLKFRKWTPT